MKSADAYDRLRVALKSELQRNFGRIQEIERELSRSEGYLSRFCRGENSISVDVLLKCLELLDTHPGRFFGRALGSSGYAYAGLRDLADHTPDKSLSRIFKALDQLTVEAIDIQCDDPARYELPEFSATDKDRKLAEDIRDCSGIEQRRRLKNGKRYRRVGFANLYIGYLIQLCYSEPRLASKQAEAVIADFLPTIDGLKPLDRMNLALRCLNAWAFGYRMTGQLPQAALAIQSGLRIATRFSLCTMEAELIRVGAYLLNDEGEYTEALQMLSHAMIIFDELDQDLEVGKVQVQRGLLFTELNQNHAAAKSFQKALSRLGSPEPSVGRYRNAAFHGLARAARNAGDLDAAEVWLQRDLDTTGVDLGDFVRAKTLWEKGHLHYEKRELSAAEQCYLEARDLLVACEAPDVALLCMDLTRVWLDQHRFEEAVDLAESMAHLIGSFRNNAIVEAALLEYIRAAHEGRLSMKVLDSLKLKMLGSESASQSR